MDISPSFKSCNFVTPHGILVILVLYEAMTLPLTNPHPQPPALPPGWPVTMGSEFVPKFYISSHVILKNNSALGVVAVVLYNPIYLA